MSEQVGGMHGPRKDDALKREVRSELLANRATRAEEWLEPEPPGEDEPEATWALEAGPAEPYQGRTGRPSSCAAIWPAIWTAPRSRRPGRICSRTWRHTRPSSGCWTWCRRRMAPCSAIWVSCSGRWGCP
jgi:hypothetical protein